MSGTYTSCQGTVNYTYTYTDCELNSHDSWAYTYTVVPLNFSVPANGDSTVSCISAAVPPALPTVTSNCNLPLSPTGPVINDTYDGCEGTRVYTYTYTDCASNAHNWVYTYTIDYNSGLTPPLSTADTVSCPIAAVDPGAPADITDACGRTVSAVLVGSTQAPACEGTVVWT